MKHSSFFVFPFVSRETPASVFRKNCHAPLKKVLNPITFVVYYFYYRNTKCEGIIVAKIVAIVNQKGGVGKTTTCVNLAAAVAQTGKRVLLCDFDPQANATSGMGVDKTVSNGVYDVIINGVETAKAIVSTPYGDVLPSSKALAGAGVEMINLPDRQFLLKQALRQVAEQYDYIFIDCPPSLELLTLNALCAANSLLVPVQGEYFALEGLSDLMNTVRLVYATVIPRNVRLSEAPSHGKPICGYDRTCRGAEAYAALAVEFLRKNA